MAQSLNRTFSFNDNDETSLSSDRQERYQHYPQPYQDIPPRNVDVSPLPPHSSAPRDYTVSPPSPPAHRSYLASSGGADHQLPTHPSFSRRPVPPTVDHQLPAHPSVSRRPVPPSQPPSYQGDPFRHPEDDVYNEQDLDYRSSNRTPSTATPGMDNLGISAAGGGISGIALGIANTNARESGVQALRSMHDDNIQCSAFPPERGYNTLGTDTPYIPEMPYRSRGLQQMDSFSSTQPSITTPVSSGHLTPQPYHSSSTMHLTDYPQNKLLNRQSSYNDNPYQGYSAAWDPSVGQHDFDPNEIEDDGDDGMNVPGRRKSMLTLGKSSEQSLPKGAVAGGAATGGFLAGLGGLVGRKAIGGGSRDASGQYGPVSGQGPGGPRQEKSEWAEQAARRKRMRWAFAILSVLIIVGVIVGAVVGALGGTNHKTDTSSQGQSAAADDGNGDLDLNSAEIKKLLGNTDLHKVFPGIDYTPFNAQYPDCLTNPPSQNNITRDMAVLSQLTNAVRLYGTDCNQTEMVLHSIDKLSLKDMKVWLGVWQGNNATTNDRQLNAMYDILDKNGAAPFAGVIVGNEVLFRKDLTETELGTVLSDVKSNLTSKKIDLPLATSDLGTDWTAGLIENVDIVMSNVHPFFGGVAASDAAAWTWDFWQMHDVVLTQGTAKKNIIAETGWPSTGGNDCGAVNCTSKTQGSIAGIDEMNAFMADFVCQSLANRTEYFW